jgi:DNA-binding NarL/FixJ family response regulator
LRILIVVNHEPLRKHLCGILAERSEFVADISDDYKSLHKAEAINPDVILLDIGLPGLSRLEGTRRVRQCFPNSKILLLCELADAEVVQEAISLDAQGCVEKRYLDSELLGALEAVCQDRQYFGAAITANQVIPGQRPPAAHFQFLKNGSPLSVPEKMLAPRHEVEFYSDDLVLIEAATTYLAASLKAGNRTVVIATEAHRQAINHRLWAQPLNWPAVTEEGLYISLDAANVLSEIMDDTGPNRGRFLSLFDPFLQPEPLAARGEVRKIVAFGEMAGILCAQGKSGAALQVEKLWNEEFKPHDVHLRCTYPLTGQFEKTLYAQICQEHDGVQTPPSWQSRMS